MSPDMITLHIERLVLHGLAAVDQARVGAALKIELQRLLVNTMPGGGHTPVVRGRVHAGSIAAGPADTPEQVGVQVAQRVAAQFGAGPVAASSSQAKPNMPGRQGGRR